MLTIYLNFEKDHVLRRSSSAVESGENKLTPSVWSTLLSIADCGYDSTSSIKLWFPAIMDWNFLTMRQTKPLCNTFALSGILSQQQ